MSSAMPSRIQRFELTAQLGVGGMGTVYRARDPLLARDVAIKVISDPASTAELSADTTIDLRTGAPSSTDDLLREARMMAQLSHPNVLPVHEVGLSDGRMFVVMEHIDGSDLAGWLETPRTTPEILGAFAQAARGLAAAHERGIVHRDFKPQNVLVGYDGRVRVADFGLSRLTANAASMVRFDDGRGTPHYMAPELWKSGAATAASDVYAFCVALSEALGDRGVAPALRAAVDAGLAEDPAERPDANAIAHALAGRGRRRWVAPLVAAVGIAGLVAIAAGVRARSGPSCGADSPLADGFGARQHAALAFALDPSTPARRAMTDRIIASWDLSVHELDERWHATCVASRDGELTEQQTAVQRSCLERRGFELTAKVEQMIRQHPSDLGTILDRARTAEAADCLEVNTPPIRDRAAALDMYRRAAASDYLPPGKPRIAPLLAVVDQAQAAGEQELAARTLVNIGQWQTASGALSEGDATEERAYRMVVDMHATRLQALALMWRSENAGTRGDAHEATSLANVALGLVESPNASPAIKARIYAEMAHAEMIRSQPEAAIKWIDKGLDMVAKDGHRMVYQEYGLLADKSRLLGMVEGRRDESLAAARELAEFTRVNLGDTSPTYARALGILGSTLQYAGHVNEGLAAREQGIAIAEKTFSTDDPNLWAMRGDYAAALETAERYEDARKIFAAELAVLDTSQLLAAQRPLVTYHLGYTTCGVGRVDEGLALLQRAIELGTSQYGATHQYVQHYVEGLLDRQLDFDRLADAEKTIARLDALYRAQPGDHTRSLVTLDGVYRARLAAERHDPHRAELLTRKAIAAWSELHGDRFVQADLLLLLGDELLDQKQWADAARQLDSAAELAKSLDLSDGQLAQLEINRQRAAAGLKRPLDIERIKAARAVVAREPGLAPAVRQADELLRH
jgi:tetratricopeptide (TPR) repeat protein